jgi:outer membrane murein-binding lipoprotein Lpp
MAKYKSDINLFDCIFKDKTKKAINLEKEIKKSLIIFGVVAVGAFVVFGGACATQKVLLENVKNQITKLNTDYDFNEIQATKEKGEKLDADNTKIREELDNFEKASRFKTDYFKYILAAQPETTGDDSVMITEFEYSEGQIKLECLGESQLAVAKFVSALRVVKDENGDVVFSNVDYTGASKNNGKWNSTLTIKVRNKAEEEAEKQAEEDAKAAAEASQAASEEANADE